MTNRELAEKIAADLFVNGGDRLKLVRDPVGAQPEKDLGGWSKPALARYIKKILDETKPITGACE